MKTIKTVSILVAMMFVVAACGSSEKPSTGFSDEPAWVTNPIKGCGVGSSKDRGIRDLTRKAAIASARDDLARQLKMTVQGMIKQYKAMGETEGKEFAEEQTTQVSRNMVNTTMVGSIVKRTGMVKRNYYAMVCLDPETFADAFDKMNEMGNKMRAALKKRAKAEFADLDKQLEKMDN